MIEIAISLAVIGFALVAIIGVLPIGMNVQKANREETILNQDASVFINAIRNGAQGLDDLTNYVTAITNWSTTYSPIGVPLSTFTYGYSPSGSTVGNFPIINGYRIVGLLSTPKYVPAGADVISNHVVAYVRSMSGAASEKFPQDNQAMHDLTFSYRLTVEVVPYGTNNYFDPSWTADANYAKVVPALQANLHDVRLYFAWPLLPNGSVGKSGESFRTLASGYLTNDLSQGPCYFFQPRTYVNTP